MHQLVEQHYRKGDMAKIKLNRILQNNFGNLVKKTVFIVISTILVSGFVYFSDNNFNSIPTSLAGAGHNLSGYAWSENIGWISFNNTTGGGAVNYGVNIDMITGDLSGYAWSENIGWIMFNPTVPLSFVPNNSAKLDITTNQITGWARACAGTVNGDCISTSRTDGWDGWIKMSGTASNGSSYGVTRSSGANCGLSGYAWGSDVVGWISFKGIAGNGSPYGVSSALCEASPCNEIVTVWGECECPKEIQTKSHINAQKPGESIGVCYNYTEERPCDRAGKNSCRDFNYREVAP